MDSWIHGFMEAIDFNSQFPTVNMKKSQGVKIRSWLLVQHVSICYRLATPHGESVVEQCNLIVQRCAKIMQHGNGVHSGKQDRDAVHKISTDTGTTRGRAD